MFRWVVHKQVYVVYLTIHLDQLSLEVLANLVADDFEPMDSIRVKYVFPTFGNEDQVNVELKNAVSTVSDDRMGLECQDVRSNIASTQPPAARQTRSHAKRVPRTVQRRAARTSRCVVLSP